jgi:hypothetical protein
MNLPGVGPAAISYEPTPGEPAPAERHPVTVTVEAGALALPRSLWNEQEQAAAEDRQAAILHYLEACCTALDPAYAVLHSEDATPTPTALATGRRLGIDIYVSRRLGHRLTDVARLSETREWPTGTFYSGWFLAQTANREALLAAWARPSLVIGRHLVDSARARAA